MKVEQCISHTYTVHLSTKGNRSESFRFDFKPSISDVFSAMKVLAHKSESRKTDMEILMQLLVLVKADDFRRAVEIGAPQGSPYCIWVADVQVGSWSIAVQECWNTWIQNWRPDPKPAPAAEAPPSTEEIPF